MKRVFPSKSPLWEIELEMKTTCTESNASILKANVLLALQFLSDFGDQITSALLALCLLDISKSTEKVGLVYLITTLGYVVFTLAGGFLGDRLSRRHILFCSDFGRGVMVLLLIVALKEKSILLIYATSFLLSVLGSLHRPVQVSTWAETIPSKYLERYNSLSELSVQGSSILGPLIASFFVLKEWSSLGFAVDASTFFICAIVFIQIVKDKEKTVSLKPETEKRNFLKGFKLLFHEPEILKYVSYDAIQMIGFGAFNATFLILAQRDFGWSKAEYSYHLSIVAIFTTLGALLGATSFVAKINPIHKLTGCALISGLALGVVLKIQVFPMCSFLVGICDGLTVLTMALTRTKVQLLAKYLYPDSLTSIIAARYILIKAATLLGIGICLMIDDFMSLRSTLILFAFPIGLSFLPFFLKKNKALVAHPY